ncbi:MAG: diguanylate cyclase [Acidobacteria bacterium]|nr:diguanylate cyclase [Acidobacteriota bacterium]MCB9399686.1 diguanylate cyclase [Acidobacteriota bacterium]
MSQSSVSQIATDPLGFLWVGTQYGLNRFDGYGFRIFLHDPQNPRSLSDNEISAVFVDRQGRLWLGTGDGLCLYRAETEDFDYFAFPNAQQGYQRQIQRIFQAHDDSIWVANAVGGLYRFDPFTSQWKEGVANLNQLDASLLNGVLSGVALDDRRLLIGAEGGLYLFEPATLNLKRVSDLGDPTGWVEKILAAPEGWWLATTQGLYFVDRDSQTPKAMWSGPEEIGRDRIYDLLVDSENTLWAAGLAGLYALRPQGGLERFLPDPADPNAIGPENTALGLDSSGALWVFSSYKGLLKLGLGHYSMAHYRHIEGDPNSLSGNSIRCMLFDDQARLWIGTYRSGLNLWQPEQGRFLAIGNETNALPSPTVLCLVQDPDRTIWVGTTRGWALLNADTFTLSNPLETYPALAQVKGRLAFCLLIQDQKWYFGTNEGLYLWDRDSDQVQVFQHDENNPNSLIQDGVVLMTADRQGILWLTTFGGISRFDPQTQAFSNYDKVRPSDPKANQGLQSGDISEVLVDHRDRVWIATLGGLHLYLPESDAFQFFGKAQGLPDETLYGVVEDKQGYLWLTTNNGLLAFEPNTQQVRHYTVVDGIQNREFNQGARAIAADGRIAVGGINGINVFYPDQLGEYRFTPNLMLSAIYCMNERLQPGSEEPRLAQSSLLAQELVLQPLDYLFSFEFVALNVHDPMAVKYEYQLQGFDPDWVPTDALNRRASYTRVPPGNYAFRLRAVSPQGQPFLGERVLNVRVLPAFYQTWWFMALCVLLTLGLLLGVYSLRMRVVRRELEQERLVNEKLQHINRQQDDFLASTSHELRTPLHGIIGLAEALRYGVAGPLSEKASTNLSLIVASGRRLAHLVNDILDFSKIRNQNLTLLRSDVDLFALTDVVLTFCQPLIKDKPVTFVNAVSSELPPVSADENRLQQILYNLVGNAVKFTQSGSITINAQEQDGRLVVSVQDTGIGIPEEEQSAIFGSFNRGRQAISGAFQGTGLGLAVTRSLVELHGGKIWVESKPGAGSIFYFTLEGLPQDWVRPEPHFEPVIREPETAVQPIPRPDLIDPAAFHILIVDDDPVNRQVLCDLLALENYHLTEAASGMEAIQFLEEHPRYDLILLDVMMPHMSGYEVCRRLRQLYPVHELPVIFLTAKSQIQDHLAGFEAGANDYLHKPISKSELLQRVQTHLHLLDVNRNLEAKVVERTQQLDAKNQELSALNQKLEQASFTDPLTGLGNRRYLRRYMDREVALVHRIQHDWSASGGEGEAPESGMVFLLFDLDHFKRVNDIYGHLAGDRVLKTVPELMAKVAREYDVLVRWGGEEFLMIFRNVARASATKLAERLRLVFEDHAFELGEAKQVHLTVSIGFSYFPFNPTQSEKFGWEHVLDIADSALYLAKNSGRNAWFGLGPGSEPFTPDAMPHMHQSLERCIQDQRLTVLSSRPFPGTPVKD